MTSGAPFLGVAWPAVVDQLRSRGWARLPAAVDRRACEALELAAPGPWTALADEEGAGVRQAGLTCHRAVDEAAGDVRRLAGAIVAAIDDAGPDADPLPLFNHVEWCRPDGGRMFITPHRDPDTAGGVIAVLTLWGAATFRIWDLDGPRTGSRSLPDPAATWETGDGDLVLMRGGGWPEPTSRCPLHEARSPAGDRMTLTLRHNKGGFGADYFA